MPPDRRRALQVVDCHAAGDVSRVIMDGLLPIPGTSLADQARYLEREADRLRRLLLSPPYGDPSWSLDLVVPPRHPEAEAGFLIAEAMGYPAFSGSNAICTATVLLESGRLALPEGEGERRVRLECPAGLVELTVRCRDGRVESVTYRAGPAWVAARDLQVTLPGHGTVALDLVWSGVLYAVVEAAPLGYALEASETPALAALGAAVIEAARPILGPEALRHPDLGDMGPLSFVHFAGPLEPAGPGRWRSRTASYVHPGVICRSPTGTGTTARLALHAAHGELEPGDGLETLSPFGTSFQGRLLENAALDSRQIHAVIPVKAGIHECGPLSVGPGEVASLKGRPRSARGHAGPPIQGVATTITGRAQVIGKGEIVIDLEDPAAEATGLSGLFRT